MKMLKNRSWTSRFALLCAVLSLVSTTYTMFRLDQNRRVMNADLAATLHSLAQTNMYMILASAYQRRLAHGSYPRDGRVDQQHGWAFREQPLCGAHLDKRFFWTSTNDGSGWAIRCEDNSIATDASQFAASPPDPVAKMRPSLVHLEAQ